MNATTPIQMQGPASPPKPQPPEDDLDAALNGQEPTVKNLILAAIGVMKVRLKTPYGLEHRDNADLLESKGQAR